MGEWINKLVYIHTAEHHSAIKMFKLLIYTTTCMNCESIAYSKRSQSQLYFVIYNSGRILYQSLGVGQWGDYKDIQTFPGGSDGKESAYSAGDPGFDPWVRKLLWRREWLPTPVFWPEEFHGQRSLVGYSPWGHKESDRTE